MTERQQRLSQILGRKIRLISLDQVAGTCCNGDRSNARRLLLPLLESDLVCPVQVPLRRRLPVLKGR